MIGVHIAIDHPMLRDALCAALSRETDFRVIECSRDGVTGSEVAAALKPDVIVASDGPRESPRDIVVEFRARTPQAKIVMLLFARRASEVGDSSGADAVVDAAGGLDELRAAIRSVAAH